MAYHKKNIEKGVYGDFSKITEEYEELKDAIDQDCKILILNEISDLLGSIKGFVEKNTNYNLTDFIQMMELTESSFKEGKRI